MIAVRLRAMLKCVPVATRGAAVLVHVQYVDMCWYLNMLGGYVASDAPQYHIHRIHQWIGKNQCP